jgi:hypothetical protein
MAFHETTEYYSLSNSASMADSRLSKYIRAESWQLEDRCGLLPARVPELKSSNDNAEKCHSSCDNTKDHGFVRTVGRFSWVLATGHRDREGLVL